MAGFGCSIGDIVLLSRLSSSVYKSSKQAGREFRSITQDVESLQTSLHTLHEEIENPISIVNRASDIQRGELAALMNSCRADLEDIKQKIDGLQLLRKIKARTGDRVRLSDSTQAEVRSKVTRNSDRLDRFLNGLHVDTFEGLEETAESHIESVGEFRGVVGRVEGNTQRHTQSFGEIALRLDKIHQDVLQRKRNPSILRDTESRATLEREIIDDNITEIDVKMNRSELSNWLEHTRGTASFQELLKDITNNPWIEVSRVPSPKSMPQAFPRRNECVRNNDGRDGEKTLHHSTQRSRAGENSTSDIQKPYQATVENYDSDDKEFADRDMESGAANFYDWGKDEAENYISEEEGEEYYTAEEEGAMDCNWENSDKEATQKDCGVKKSDEDATKKHCRAKKSEEDPIQNDCKVKKNDEDPTQKHCKVKKSDQKRERYSSRDRRMGRSINRRPDCTARSPEQHKDTTVHFDPGFWFPDLTGNSHATILSHYDSSNTEQAYETNERTRRGVGECSSHDVADANFQKGEEKANQVVINLQLTLFDIVEKGRIFVDMYGELLCVPLENSVRDGREISFMFRSKSICFSIKEKQVPSYHSCIFGDDITYRATIDLGEAFCGWRRLVHVPNQNDCRLIHCEGLSNSLWPVTIRQCGLPKLADPSTRGDLIVHIEIMYPGHFSSEQKAQVAAILEETTMKLNCDIA